MTKSFEIRILGMISRSTKVEILETDHTSVLFVVTLKDRFRTRRHKGIFYPSEWSIHGKIYDDFELEDDEYVETSESG